MLDFEQKRKLRKIIYHPLTLTGLFVVVVFFMHSTWVVYEKKEQSAALLEASQSQLQALQSRDSDLKAKIEDLNTEAGEEEEIRSKFSVEKPGEQMVVVVDSPTQVAPTSTPPSLWQKTVGFFNHLFSN